MNNTKRRISTCVIAAVVCFTMILGSFGAILGTAFGILSNEDLINAINNGSISVGDLALLASLNPNNLNFDGQDVTDIAKDGYQKKENSSEIGDKTTDYDTYNKPYYNPEDSATQTTLSKLQTSFAGNGYKTGVTAAAVSIDGTSFTTIYGAQSGVITPGSSSENKFVTIDQNTLYYLANGMRCAAAKGGYYTKLTVSANTHLVIAMATAEEIIAADNASSNDYTLNGSNYGYGAGKVFADTIFDNVPSGKAVYGVAFNRTYFELLAGASLTLLGRDFNDNGYIDDKPVEVTVNGTKYWFYEKIVLSGSSAYQDYDPVVGKTLNGGQEVFDNKDGVALPLISVYGGTASNTSAKLIISGADLRNNFNEKVPTIPSSAAPGTVDDVVTGGGAIYLASGSASGQPRNATTGGWFKEVIITNTRFSYCGAVRGGAIMVGKNFYSSTLDLSYCDYDHCYTAYYNYKSSDTNQGTGESDQSGDGGAVCFYQDDTTTEDWYATKNHNNPSLIYVGTADFTGSSFSFCYAMRAGGAIHFGGYHYNTSDLTANSAGHVTDHCGLADRPDMLGTQIKTLKLDFCDFYCCGAGWAMKDAPGIADSDFIFTTTDKISSIAQGDLFYGLEGVTDYVTAKNPGTDNLFTEINPWGDSYPGLKDLQWLRLYDDTQVAPNTNTAPRNLHNWYNIPQMKFAGACREGGAIFFNCRVGEMSMRDCTFIYCAADSNGGAVFLDDRFVCPSAIVENCLFKNNMSNESTGGGSDTGTFRSTGLAAADIHFNNCSFLYNLNFGGGGALYLNLNNTYTSPYAANTTYNVAKPQNDATTQRNKDKCAGSEVNNCLFFGNFAIWSGAAIRCTGVMDINSSTFAHNISNNGYAGAIYFLTYERPLVDVATEKAQMRFDIQYGDDFDGHTIVCYNEVGGTTSGGGGIAISATHSPSVGKVGTTITSTDSGKTITSREYSFDFALNGVLVFNNTASGGGGGIYFRVNDDAAPNDTVAHAWVYDKNVYLNDGYVFNNYAYGVGGGVRVRDDCSVRDGATKVEISGAYVYQNESAVDGGGLYVLAEGGVVDIMGGYVVANEAPDGAGIYVKDTRNVNITGGNIGATKYGAPTLTRGASDTTFTPAASATRAGGNVATGNGGGICIETAFTEETYFVNDTAVTMSGGIIEANKAGTGGGLYMVRGSVANAGIVNFTMNKSSDSSAYGFYGNTAASGAGIYASSNNATAAAQRYVVNLNGGEVSNNVASSNGGGAFITGGAKLVVSGCIMDSNEAVGVESDKTTGNGGAIYINSNTASADISNGQISKNTASHYGGGIHAFDADVTVIGGNITGNESGTAGGGLAIRGSASLTMNGGNVSANNAEDGGGVFVSGASAVANINGGTIGAGNEATTNGGGVYVNDSATVTLTGGKVDGNTAVQNGGGIYVTGTDNFKMDGGAISNNTVTNGNGGGIYIDGSGSTITKKAPKDAIKSDGTLDETKLTLNVGIMTREGGSTTWMTAAEAQKVQDDFENYLVNVLGFERSLFSINYSVQNRETIGNVEKTLTAIFDDFTARGLTAHVIVGGGNNIYGEELAKFGYDNWGTTSGNMNDTTRVPFLIHRDYSAKVADRNIAPLTKGVGNGKALATVYFPAINDLTELFFRYFLRADNTNKINTAATATSAGLVGTYTIPGDPYKSTLASGNITGNKALNGYGGGFCCNASTVNLTANDNTSYPVINTNTAKNGGGVAVINGGSVTMQGGYVTGNSAKCVDANYVNTNTTSYQRHSDLEGVGGGIYVANELGSSSGIASFSIKDYNNFYSGIYLNNAEFAADDVFANAVNTKLDVPAFKSMHIMGDAGNVTGWFEDYATGDVNYTTGLNGIRDLTGEEVLRYDFAAANGKNVFEAWIDKKPTDSDSVSNPMNFINEGSTFVCVTLGAYVVYDGNLTITKDIDGTVDTEQVFIFHVKRLLDQYGNEAADVNIFVTINGEGSVTISSLPLGTYEVTEITDWSWRYSVTKTSISAAQGTVSDTSAKANDAIVKFEMLPVDADEGLCNDPTVTFTNKLTKTPWLDGNSQKVVNTAGQTNIVTKELAYTNFKREETLI